MRTIIPALLFILLAMPVMASVDLVSPSNGYATANSTIYFDYLPIMDDLESCTVLAGPYNFPDTNVDPGTLNSIGIQNIDQGSYRWNVTCYAVNETETSASRWFTVDQESPSLIIISPQNDGEGEVLSIDFVVSDNIDSELECQLTWGDEIIDTVVVTNQTRFVKNYTRYPGEKTLNITCQDDAGNVDSESVQYDMEPELFLNLNTDKDSYGITEQVKLTIDTVPTSNITIDVCPNEAGFVVCSSAIITTEEFPQTITLPNMNKTGEYVIEGFVRLGDQTILERITYSIDNTMSVKLTENEEPKKSELFTVSASATGGIAPYRYVWKLHNGTVVETGNSVNINFTTSGEKSINLTVYDDALNQVSQSKIYSIKPVYDVTFFVKDNNTGEAIVSADVEFADMKEKTVSDGRVFFRVESGTHTLFVSKPGYDYYIWDIFVNKTTSLIINMDRSQQSLSVDWVSPESNAQLSSPVELQYSFQYDKTSTCTLYIEMEEGWYEENGTNTHSEPGTYSFTRDLTPGVYNTKVGCVDLSGLSAETESRSFTVTGDELGTETLQANTEPAPEELNIAAENVQKIIDRLEQADRDTQKAIASLEIDKRLRNLARTLKQAVRDIDSLNYRADLNSEQRQQERKKILDNAKELLETTPVDIRVADKNTFVDYVEETDLDSVFEMLKGVEGWEDSKSIRKKILEDQQKFTVSSTVYHIDLAYNSGDTEQVTLISRDFTFKEGIEDGYLILELIPKDVLNSAESIELLTKGEVLKEDPVLMFKKQAKVEYLVKKKVDDLKSRQIQTMLTRNYVEAGTKVDAFVLLPISFRGWTVPVVLVVLLIVFVYLGFHFNMLQKIKYLIYKIGRNEEVHYLRVLIGDAEDQLDAQNYDKADMLYKEIRMSYETLPTPARNDLYEEVMSLVHKMDGYYFNMIMIELDRHLKNGDMEAAIESYEKLTGTYERLDEERQQKLVKAVMGMAKRLGLEVPV